MSGTDMHFFKLFLAATFAVSASIRGLATLIDVHYGSTQIVQRLASLGPLASIIGAASSLAAGALIARRLRRRAVPKASHSR